MTKFSIYAVAGFVRASYLLHGFLYSVLLASMLEAYSPVTRFDSKASLFLSSRE
jgi:hypothetical protein